MQRFSDTLLWWPTLLLLTFQCGFTLFALEQTPTHPGVNAWNVFFPRITESFLLALVALLWWAIILAGDLPRVTEPERLIRFGSVRQAASTALSQYWPRLLAGFFALVTATAVISFPLGFTSTWSPSVHAQPATELPRSIFSAEELARHFDSPIVAAVAVLLYAFIGYLVFAAVIITLALHIGSRPAAMTMWAVYALTAVGSFAGLTDGFSTSGLFSLVLPLRYSALPLYLCVHFALILISAFLATTPPGTIRERTAALFQHRGITAVPLTLVSLLTLTKQSALIASPSDGVQHATMLFAGRHDDIIGYGSIMAITLMIAAIPIARANSICSRPEFFRQQAIRCGSAHLWTKQFLHAEFPWLLLSCIATPLVITLSTIARFPEHANFWQVISHLIWPTTAIFLLSSTVFFVAMTLLWKSPLAMVTTWIAAVTLVLGYWLPTGIANPFAPFSVNPDTLSVDVTAVWTIAALAALSFIACLVTPIRNIEPSN